MDVIRDARGNGSDYVNRRNYKGNVIFVGLWYFAFLQFSQKTGRKERRFM